MKRIYAIKKGRGFMRGYDGRWLLFGAKWVAKMYDSKRKASRVKLVQA